MKQNIGVRVVRALRKIKYIFQKSVVNAILLFCAVLGSAPISQNNIIKQSAQKRGLPIKDGL